MLRLLIKAFIKNSNDTHLPSVRMAYGQLGSIVGIFINTLLALSKVAIGLFAKSISITADGINNLSDAGSSVITLIGFKLSSKPADDDHPFGHARIEYISALIVSFLILLLGMELIKNSISKILNPSPLSFNYLMLIVLAISIGVKLWLSYFYHHLGALIHSTAMKATATDSMNDVLATSAVFISLLISKWLNFNIDAYMGLVVACFIIYSGIKIIQETVSPLLGEAPSTDLVATIEEKLKCYEGVLGIHDLMVHNYGPSRCFATVHVEVASNENILESHDMIDNIERDFITDLGIHLVIHLDPIVTDDEVTNTLRHFVCELVHSIDPKLSIHDFRLVCGTTHTNLVFDMIVPNHFYLSHKKLLNLIDVMIKEKDPSYYAVVTIDTNYISTPPTKTTQ